MFLSDDAISISKATLEEVLEAVGPYRHELEGFTPELWLDDENIALTDGAGNVTLFERVAPGVYTGHYFLKARGREALGVCREMLDEVFSLGAEVIRGLTPEDKSGARWMNRKLGFKSYGWVDTVIGPCELVILTKEEYKNE